MKKLVLAVVLCFATTAFADTASMTLTGTGSNGSAYGVFIGPYVANINGVSTPVICDDFADESYIPESWTANVTSAANLNSGLKWGNNPTLYDQAAWLALQLSSATTVGQKDAIQYAIWAVSDPTDVSSWLSEQIGGSSFYNDSSDPNGVTYWVNLAGSQPYTDGEFPNVLIYTPNTDDPITCGSGPCSKTPPQEFLVVQTPEPSSLALLVTGMLALMLLVIRRGRA
jgi:PEP-CTERM motif